MPHSATLALLSFGVLTGAAALLAFKFASRPGRIRRARDRAVSRVIELWIYRRDPVLAFRSVGGALRDSLRYLGVLLAPALCALLAALPPLWLAHDRLAFRPLRPGETVLLVARLDPGAPLSALEGVSPRFPPGLAPLHPPVRSPRWREAAWALAVLPPSGAPDAAAIDPRPLRGHFRANRPPGFRAPELRLPPAEYDLLGWRADWLRGLAAVSLAAGLLLKRPLGAGL